MIWIKNLNFYHLSVQVKFPVTLSEVHKKSQKKINYLVEKKNNNGDAINAQQQNKKK